MGGREESDRSSLNSPDVTGVTSSNPNDCLVAVSCVHDKNCDGPATVGGVGTAASEEHECVKVCGVKTHGEAAGHVVNLDGHDTAVLLGEGVVCRTCSVTVEVGNCVTDHSNLYGILMLAGDSKETGVACEAPGDKVLTTLLIKLSIGYSSGVVGV